MAKARARLEGADLAHAISGRGAGKLPHGISQRRARSLRGRERSRALAKHSLHVAIDPRELLGVRDVSTHADVEGLWAVWVLMPDRGGDHSMPDLLDEPLPTQSPLAPHTGVPIPLL